MAQRRYAKLQIISFDIIKQSQIAINNVMQQQKTLAEYFSDYPSILRGLKKLKITTPTDFQQQLFEIENDMDNLIVAAPAESGKTIALLLYALRKFINEESGILVVLCHSKELSQMLHHLVQSLSSLVVTNLFMGELGELGEKGVLIGSPLQVNNLWKKDKDKITSIVIPEADYLLGYGYGDALELLAGSLNGNKVTYKLSCVNRNDEIDRFKTTWMKKVVKIDYQSPMVQEKNKVEEQITHFYTVGDKLTLPISLYVTLKFGLVNPKILVLVDNIREVYRYSLFLERCKVGSVSIYNHQNPTNLKFYCLSVWMNGTTNILIATKHILQDLSHNIFKQNVKKAYKRKQFELINMTSIITIGLGFLQSDYSILYEHFQLKPFIMTFLENTETEITLLQQLIAYEHGKFEHATIKEIPIGKQQLQAFRYRINDVWSTLNNHKVDLYQQLDFKKKLLKTPELKQEFDRNGKQREVLVKAINEIRKKIDHGKVTIFEYVPEYLVPECLRAAYHQKMKAIQAKLNEETPVSHMKVKRVLRHIDLDDENPETTDISRLKLISSRKRWKLLHGFKLKKRNKRLEQKGIFETG